MNEERMREAPTLAPPEAREWMAFCLHCGQEYGPSKSEARASLWRSVHQALNNGHLVTVCAAVGLRDATRAGTV